MTNEEKLKSEAWVKFPSIIGADDEGFIIDLNHDKRIGFIEGAKWQQQQAPDMEEVRKQYIDKFGNNVNFSGEDGDFNPKLLYAIFDFFAPMIKGSDAKTLDEAGIIFQYDQYYFDRMPLSFRKATPDQLRAIANHMEKQTKKG